MLSRKERIDEGDFVVVYETFGNAKIIQVTPGQIYNSKFGNFHHKDMVGAKYGSKATAKAGNGTVTLLNLTPQLWTEVLSLRTQILFQTDIAMVLHNLDVRPGSVVVEAGTGSGSLSTSFARALAPHGHLHTFEFNADRVKKAKVDFANNKLDHLITVRHRDVCDKGFPRFEAGVDAYFLDLPTPWVVLDSVHASLRPQGRICSFSPCIEQVQRTCLKLAQLGYEDIETVECLLRPYEVNKNPLRILNVFEAPLKEGPKWEKKPNRGKGKGKGKGDEEGEDDRENEDGEAAEDDDGNEHDGDNEKEGGASEMEESKQQHGDNKSDATAGIGSKRKAASEAIDAEKKSRSAEDEPSSTASSTTVSSTTSSTLAPCPPEDLHSMHPTRWAIGSGASMTPVSLAAKAIAVQPELICRPPPTMRGHTGYLTFARKPASVPKKQQQGDSVASA